MTLKEKATENIVGIEENACNQHFLLFLYSVFYPSQNKFQIFCHIYFCRLQMLSIWTSIKFCVVESQKTNSMFVCNMSPQKCLQYGEI